MLVSLLLHFYTKLVLALFSVKVLISVQFAIASKLSAIKIQDYYLHYISMVVAALYLQSPCLYVFIQIYMYIHTHTYIHMTNTVAIILSSSVWSDNHPRRWRHTPLPQPQYFQLLLLLQSITIWHHLKNGMSLLLDSAWKKLRGHWLMS